MDLLRRVRDAVKHAVEDLLGDGTGPSSTVVLADPFSHPGTLMGAREVALLRQRVAAAELPWADAAVALACDTPREYSPNVLPRVYIDYNGVGQGHDEFVERDGKMVYMQAVMFVITGDEQYAHNAARILWAWATVNQSFRGRNAPLESGWGIASMARSAELLKWTWAAWPTEVEAAFLGWVDRVIMPNLRDPSLNHLPLGNWHSTIAEAKAQLAILRGDRRLFQEALYDWQKVASAYLRPWGECTETSRDLFHSQFGLGGLVQVAELAWHQGVDLYSHDDYRLCRALEFHALITNGGVPRQCTYPLCGIGFLPCGWEVAYNHYSGRLGIPMPETERLLDCSRPERYVFHWGLGTLTHYGTALPVPARLEPADAEEPAPIAPS